MSQTLGLVLVMGMLAILAARTVGPVKAIPSGKELLTVHTKLIDRVLLHRFHLMSMLVVLTLGSSAVGGWISQPLFLLGIGGAVVLLSVPTRHVFTSDGFNLHTATTRAWKDCRGYRLEGRRVVILGDHWSRRATLYMAEGARPDLERLLRGRGLRPDRRPNASSTAKAGHRR